MTHKTKAVNNNHSKKSITSHSNTNEKNIKKNPNEPKRDQMSKKVTWLEEYKDMFGGLSHPVTESFLNRIAQELIAYVEDPEIELLRIDNFFVKKRIHPTTGIAWANKYPEFGAIYKTCKAILGWRRENGAMREGWNASVVMQTMPMFDEEYKQLKEWENRMKNDTMNSGKVMVLMTSHNYDNAIKIEDKQEKKDGQIRDDQAL